MTTFVKGATITLINLSRKPELNGSEGIVLGEANDDGRYPVQLSQGGKDKLRVKPQNLQRKANKELVATMERMTRTSPLIGLLRTMTDTSTDAADKADCPQAVVALVLVEDEEALILEANSALIAHVSRPTASFSLEPEVRVEEEIALRISALNALMVLCGSKEHVPRLLAAGVLSTLRAQLKIGKAPAGGGGRDDRRAMVPFHVLDLLGVLANTEMGRREMAESMPTLEALVQASVDGGSGGKRNGGSGSAADSSEWSLSVIRELRTGAMGVVTALLKEPKCWTPLLRAGVVSACVLMLQQPAESEAADEGAVKAATALSLYSGVIKAETIHDEPDVLDALHQTAKGRHGEKAAEVARQTLQRLMARMHEAGLKLQPMMQPRGAGEEDDGGRIVDITEDSEDD